VLECPYCRAKFKLTWKRYFLGPFSVHRCPECRRRSRLGFEPAVFIRELVVVFVAGSAGGLLALWLFGPSLPLFLLGILLPPLAVGLPLDKYYDEYYRELKRMRLG